MRKSIALAVAVLILVACQQGSPTTPAPSGPDTADLPPAGQIWFGKTFDPQTFAVSDRSTTFPSGQPVAVVAHLSKPVDMATANLRVSVDGTNVVNQGTGQAGQADTYGVTITPPAAGHYLVELTDVGGNVLASASFDAR